MPDQDNSHKALRDYCRQLGLTAASTGQSIDRLIGQAKQTDDPRAWLAAFSDAPPDDETPRPSPAIAPAAAGPIVDRPPAETPVGAPADLIELDSIPTREDVRAELTREGEQARLKDGEVVCGKHGELIDPLRIGPASVPTTQAVRPELMRYSELSRQTLEQVAAYHGLPRAALGEPDPEGPAIRTIAIELPISDEEPVGYLEREMHLDVRLDPAASRAFRRLWKALDAQNARLQSRRHVGKSRADVVRWVFEQLALALEPVKQL